MKCAIEHDQCQSTQVFYLAGQNLAKSGDAENDWIVGTRPAKWFSEYENGDMEEIRSHSSLKGANGYVREVENIRHFVRKQIYGSEMNATVCQLRSHYYTLSCILGYR